MIYTRERERLEKEKEASKPKLTVVTKDGHELDADSLVAAEHMLKCIVYQRKPDGSLPATRCIHEEIGVAASNVSYIIDRKNRGKQMDTKIRPLTVISGKNYRKEV